MDKTKHTYYKIDCEDSRALGLSGSDKDVFFFIRSYKEGCTMKQQTMAELLCMGERTLQRSLLSLVSRGLVEKVTEKKVNGGSINTYMVVDMETVTLRQNDVHPSAILSPTLRQIDATPSAKLSPTLRQNDTPYLLGITQGNDTKYDDTSSRAREEEMKKNGAILTVAELTAELRKEIADGGSVVESAQRLYNIGKEDLLEYVGWFEDKLTMDKVTYKSRSDYRRHFNNWLRIQAEQLIKRQERERNGKYSSRTENAADLFTELG